MKKQSMKGRMDEKLSMKHGKESSKEQSMKSRRHEASCASKAGLHCKMGMEHTKGHKGK